MFRRQKSRCRLSGCGAAARRELRLRLTVTKRRRCRADQEYFGTARPAIGDQPGDPLAAPVTATIPPESIATPVRTATLAPPGRPVAAGVRRRGPHTRDPSIADAGPHAVPRAPDMAARPGDNSDRRDRDRRADVHRDTRTRARRRYEYDAEEQRQSCDVCKAFQHDRLPGSLLETQERDACQLAPLRARSSPREIR